MDSKPKLAELVFTGNPFILRNFFNVQENSFYFNVLKKRFGSEVIPAREPHKDKKKKDHNKYLYKPVKVKDYLSNNKKNRKSLVYLSNFSIDRFKLSDFKLKYPKVHINKKQFEKPRLWIGSKGCFTPLHRDTSDNYVYQVVGIKQWTIFNVQDDKNLYYITREELYPYAFRNNDRETINKISEFSTSHVNLKKPDFRKFPLFRKAQPINFKLHPGDFLYLPAGYGHAVENTELSISINLWEKLSIHKPAVLR
jgi:mannose-6-phosphate isomerase class I